MALLRPGGERSLTPRSFGLAVRVYALLFVALKASFSCQKPLKSKIQKHMIYWNTELSFLKIWLKGLKTARLP